MRKKNVIGCQSSLKLIKYTFCMFSHHMLSLYYKWFLSYVIKSLAKFCIKNFVQYLSLYSIVLQSCCFSKKSWFSYIITYYDISVWNVHKMVLRNISFIELMLYPWQASFSYILNICHFKIYIYNKKMKVVLMLAC